MTRSGSLASGQFCGVPFTLCKLCIFSGISAWSSKLDRISYNPELVFFFWPSMAFKTILEKSLKILVVVVMTS